MAEAKRRIDNSLIRRKLPLKTMCSTFCAEKRKRIFFWSNRKFRFVFTSVKAHIIEIEPMLFKTVTKVARARSALLAWSRFSSRFMWPKLEEFSFPRKTKRISFSLWENFTCWRQRDPASRTDRNRRRKCLELIYRPERTEKIFLRRNKSKRFSFRFNFCAVAFRCQLNRLFVSRAAGQQTAQTEKSSAADAERRKSNGENETFVETDLVPEIRRYFPSDSTWRMLTPLPMLTNKNGFFISNWNGVLPKFSWLCGSS